MFFQICNICQENDIECTTNNMGGFFERRAMTEIRIKSAPWPSAQAFTATVTPEAPRSGNVLQDSYNRLGEADQLREQGKFDRAQKVCESLIREHPDYMAAHHTLGLIHAGKENYDRAFDHLSRAAMLNPRSCKTLTVLASVCLQLRAFEMAVRFLEQARAIKPRDSNILVTLGEVYEQEREYERAKEAFREAIALEDTLLPAHLGLGKVCMHLGQIAEAVEVYEDLIKRGMSTVEGLLALSNLPLALVNVDLLAELDKLSNKTGDSPEFAKAATFVRHFAFHKAGRHAEAWQLLASANRAIFLARQKDLRYLHERQSNTLTWLRENPIKAVGDNRDSKQPISLFILGPSRSGKTTMERLVATLDGVKRGYENPGLEKAIRRTFQSASLPPGDHIELVPLQLYPHCRENYLEEVAQRTGSASVFTTTSPGRIFDAHALASVFPNVRFICLKRNLEDNILRIYQRLYLVGNFYSYDVKAARDSIVWYHQMIDLLAKKLPDFVRVIDYEDMVANPAAAVRVAADLCGLPRADGPLPKVGDDRGCAEPYRDFIRAELSQRDGQLE
jgi:tetratricopeptide (TPR) repeat protein